MTPISKRHRARFYIYKYPKKSKRLYIYPKSQTLFKQQENLCYVFIHKKLHTLCYAIFHGILEIGICIYIKNDTLRYVTFFNTKSQTLLKKQDNLRYIFIYKKPDTLRCVIFHGTFEISRGVGGHFYIQKTMHIVSHFYILKKSTLCYVFVYNLLYSNDTQL